MTTLLCTHHNGIIVYDSNGVPQVIGGHGQSIETARAAATNTPPPATTNLSSAQPVSTSQTKSDRNVKGDGAHVTAGATANVTGVATVPLTSSQLNMSAAIRQLFNDGVLTVVG